MNINIVASTLTVRVKKAVEAVRLNGEEFSIDLNVLYRFLKCIYEGRSELGDIVECGFSRTTVTKYVGICRSLGLVDVVVEGRKKKVKITKKAMDFLIMYERMLRLLESR